MRHSSSDATPEIPESLSAFLVAARHKQLREGMSLNHDREDEHIETDSHSIAYANN
jgi:hypothetical protein